MNGVRSLDPKHDRSDYRDELASKELGAVQLRYQVDPGSGPSAAIPA
jgi:hypothetical protein